MACSCHQAQRPCALPDGTSAHPFALCPSCTAVASCSPHTSHTSPARTACSCHQAQRPSARPDGASGPPQQLPGPVPRWRWPPQHVCRFGSMGMVGWGDWLGMGLKRGLSETRGPRGRIVCLSRPADQGSSPWQDGTPGLLLATRTTLPSAPNPNIPSSHALSTFLFSPLPLPPVLTPCLPPCPANCCFTSHAP